MRYQLLLLLFLIAMPHAHGNAQTHHPELFCHRTANKDVPENTLESIEFAARLGCDVVEIDVRKTLDGKLILNHDGLLERLTDGPGDVATTLSTELDLRDAGDWMGPRFHGLHIAHLEDAISVAREMNIRLILDVKVKGIDTDVLNVVRSQNALSLVSFGGESSGLKAIELHALDPTVRTMWVGPIVSASDVDVAHKQGKRLVANFSANAHEMDLAGMKSAVAAGADAINVDYPLLGADAVGRPVANRIGKLIVQANSGAEAARIQAIFELSKFYDASLHTYFLVWLATESSAVSRAAAVALLTMRPAIQTPELFPALSSKSPNARANSVWLLGMLNSDSTHIEPLLKDASPEVVREALLAISRSSTRTCQVPLIPFLTGEDVSLRGPAALAMAHVAPDTFLELITAQVGKQLSIDNEVENAYNASGRKQITPAQIATVQASFRSEMQMLRAIASINSPVATHALAELALLPGSEFTQMFGQVVEYKLWDHAAGDVDDIVIGLGSPDSAVADRTEWTLIKAGNGVLSAVRAMLNTPSPLRSRAIRIVAWQSDRLALPQLQKIAHAEGSDKELAAWAIGTIEARPTISKD